MAIGKSGRSALGGRAAGFFLTIAALSLFLPKASFPAPKLDVYDPFEVMAEVRRLERSPLWPGFEPQGIPVGFYNGERTYLFDFPEIPMGFVPVEGRPGVLVYEGRHPAVFGNVRFQLDGVWIAASIPVRRSYYTGKDVTITEAAAVVLHEKFHVFQVIRHPDWRTYDDALLSYPLDSAETLEARSREVEALRRAVLSLDPGDIAWAKTAWALRNERFAKMGGDLIQYERESRRLEGLAEYVEYEASGKPAAEGPLPLGFAPKAIRDMGYTAGRWIAVLLDRFDPQWKEKVEAGFVAYPEDLLGEFLRGHSDQAKFTAEENAAWSSAVRTALAENAADRQRIVQNMKSKLGITVVIDARRRPLSIEAFEPFSVEAVEPGVILHNHWISLKNASGLIHVFDRPVLTETDDLGRVVRITIPGLSRRISLPPKRRNLRFLSDGLLVMMKSVRVIPRGFYGYTVELR